MIYKTVLAPGAPWPEVGEWPEKPKFKHVQKPVRVIAKKKPEKVQPEPTQRLSKVTLDMDVFKGPNLDPLAEARKQLSTPETRVSRHRHSIKNLNLAPKPIFYFAKARSSK